MQLLRTSLAGFDESGCDHVASKSGFSHSLLLFSSASRCFVLRSVRWTVFVMCGLRQSFDHLMYFVLSEAVRVALKINLHALFPFLTASYICFMGILYFGAKWAFYIENLF